MAPAWYRDPRPVGTPERAQGGVRAPSACALASLDAQKASAMVPSDRTMIMEAIETSVGLDEFNRLVREKMLDEFKRAAIQSTMR